LNEREVDQMSDSSIEKALAKLSVEFRSGMAEMAAAVHQTNAKIDQTNFLLAQTQIEHSKFERTINKKLDGIGSCLKSIDGTFGRHEQRISDLDSRVSDIEKAG